MRTFLLVLAVFGFADAFGQKIRWSVAAGVNYTVIEDVEKGRTVTAVPITSGYVSTTVNAGTVEEVFKGSAGFFVGGKASIVNTRRFFLTSGLTFQYTRFNRLLVVAHLNPGVTTLPTAGQPIGSPYGNFVIRDANGNIIIDPGGQPVSLAFQSSSRRGDTQVLSLQVPLLVGTDFFGEKLRVELGFNFGHVLSASVYKDVVSLSGTMEGVNGESSGVLPWTVKSVNEKNTAAFNRFTVGLNLCTTYRVTKRVGVQLSAGRNLSPTYRNNTEFAGPSYLNSFSGGINYVISD